MRLAESRRALTASVAVSRLLGRYSSSLAEVPTALLWFIPWRVPVSERGLAKQARWLEATEPFELKASVGRVAGFTAGEGAPVLLVHGWGERAAGLGGFIEPLVRAGHRAVGLDLPAHGGSSGQTTNIIECAAAIHDVSAHFGGAGALVAHSMGANTALWALKEGLQVDAAVLLAPNVDVAYTIEMFKFLFDLPPKAIQGLKRYIERRFGPSVWHDIRGDELARGLSLPGLIFHDPEDPQVPYEGSTRLASAWPGAQLIAAQGLGHGAITRDARIIERAVSFLAAGVDRG